MSNQLETNATKAWGLVVRALKTKTPAAILKASAALEVVRSSIDYLEASLPKPATMTEAHSRRLARAICDEAFRAAVAEARDEESTYLAKASLARKLYDDRTVDALEALVFSKSPQTRIVAQRALDRLYAIGRGLELGG